MSHESPQPIPSSSATPADVAIPPTDSATLPPEGPAATLPPPGKVLHGNAPHAAVEASPAGYEIVAELGRGGMGVVYKARHAALRRLVALKMILGGGHASAADLERFRTEAEAIARLQHPHIVQIHEVGRHHGLPYFSLEFCAGGSLEKKLAGTPLPPRAAAVLVEKLASGVQAAHDKGVIHRDLKPANVLLTEDGTPKITDFGLAKKFADETTASAPAGLTQTGSVLGTPSYMAPEQAGGSSKEIGPACDIYALGAVLYECLTGRPPFRAATPLDTVLQVLNEEPVPPRQLNAGVPRDLETICLKCLQKEPAQRYGHAAALAEDLQHFLSGEPIAARPITWRQRVVKWARRRPASAALIALGLSSLVAFLALGILFYQQQEEINRQQQQALADITDQKNKVQAELWKSLIEQAKTERLVGNRQKSLDLLAEAVGIQVVPELRREAIETITSFGARLVRRIRAHSNSVLRGKHLYMAFSADGQFFAETSNYSTTPAAQLNPIVPYQGQTQVWHIPTGQLFAAFTTEFADDVAMTRGPCPIAFSPSAPLLAAVKVNQVHLTHLHTKQELLIVPGDKILGFSPDGALLAVASKQDAAVWNVAQRKQLPLQLQARSAVFTSNDKLAAWDGKRLRLWDATAGEELYALPENLVPVPCDNCDTPAMEGNHLMARRNEAGPATLVLWNIAEKKIDKEIVHAGQGFDQDGAFPVSGADRLVAAGTPANSDKAIRLFNTSTGALHSRLVPEGVHDRSLFLGRFNPQGRMFAVQEASQGVRLWDLHSGTTLKYFLGPHTPCWSPDGRYLALWDKSGLDLLIYEVTSPATSMPCAAAPQALTFSQDGSHLASSEQVWEVHQDGMHSWLRSKGPLQEGRWPQGFSPTMSTVFKHDASSYRLWSMRYGEQNRQKQPMRKVLDVSQVFPERQTFVLWEGAETPRGNIVGLGVSPDGKQMVLSRFASTAPGELVPAQGEWHVELWDLPPKKEPSLLSKAAILFNQIRFSADGQRVFLFGGGAWSIWELQPIKELCRHQQLGPKGEYLCLVLEPSPDLKAVHALAVSGNDYSYLRFDTTNQQIDNVRLVPRDQIATMALSPDGTLLAIGGQDEMVRLWDAATGQELASWRGHTAEVTKLAFSPDGRILASSGSDGVIRLWDLPFIRAELAKLKLNW